MIPKYSGYFILAVYFFISLFIWDDYGVSWDEDIQMHHGRVSALEICNTFDWECKTLREEKDLKPLQEYRQKYYGTFFQLLAIGVDHWNGADTFSKRIRNRHFLGFLIFFLGACCFHGLLRLRFGDWLALIGTLIFLTHPRIFAHSYYNPKDTLFLSMYWVCFYCFFLYLKKMRWWYLLGLGISTAIAINMRVPGIIIPLLCIGAITVFSGIEWKEKGIGVLLYVLSTFLGMFMIWPLLWTDTFPNLIAAFTEFSQFPWQNTLLYWGGYVMSDKMPWHYALSWITVTMPPLYLVLILAGFGLMGYQFVKHFKQVFTEKTVLMDSLILGAVIGPYLAVVLLDSVIYGAWRHLFFIWGGLVYMGVFAVQYLSERPIRRSSTIINGLTSLAILWACIILFRTHPHQNVYFNSLVDTPMDRFEQDYWGLSMKQGMEHLLTIIPEDKVSKVYAYDFPAWSNYLAIPKEKRTHLKFAWNEDEADYFIDMYRRKDHIKNFYLREGKYKNLIWEIKVDGSPILGLYSLDK